ncbi:MAG: hypothetical protein KAH32_08425 [Chlamydiia bacterium]|nr:hypothetical protein [Chlamydiia bacterium]
MKENKTGINKKLWLEVKEKVFKINSVVVKIPYTSQEQKKSIINFFKNSKNRDKDKKKLAPLSFQTNKDDEKMLEIKVKVQDEFFLSVSMEKGEF